jgi:uncharacterized protein with GYD domain
MVKFVMLSIISPEGATRLREKPQRLQELNAEVEGMGGRVLQQYALLGQWDFLTVIETPDVVTMTKITTVLNSRGTLKTRTLTALDVDEFLSAMEDDA